MDSMVVIVYFVLGYVITSLALPGTSQLARD